MAKRAKSSFKHTGRSKPRKAVKPRKPRQPSLMSRWIESISPESKRLALVGTTWVIVIVAVLAGAVWGLHKAEQRVFGPDKNGQVGECAELVLVDAPNWMPSMVAGRIRHRCRPFGIGFYDDQLLAEVAQRAAMSPWVRKVNFVRKRLAPDGRSGVIELSCEYRQPVACVELEHRAGRESMQVAYIDAEGVRLPFADVPKFVARFTTMEGAFEQRYYASPDSWPAHAAVWRAHYPIIRGVLSGEPEDGQRWVSPELEAGLRLFDWISSREYADQITVIDVRNHDGRYDPADAHLRLFAQIGRGSPTTILFGRFPSPDGDYVISPERKLYYLDDYTRQTGGNLAGVDDVVDLRHDQIRVPRYHN